MNLSDILVLTCDSELPSAQKLGFPTKSHNQLIWNAKVEDFDKTLVIRWGSGVDFSSRIVSPPIINLTSVPKFQPPKKFDVKHCINPSKAIQINCVKSVALRKMSRFVGTPKMKIYRVTNKQLYVHRPHQHTGGQNFSVQRGPFKVTRGWYATQFLNVEREFRVWFCNGETLVAERITYNKDKQKEKYQCRSTWCYRHFHRPNKPLHAMVLNAAKAVGLESGCADILFHKKKYYFTELNSAPSLDMPLLVDFFKKNLTNMVKERYPGLLKEKPELKRKSAKDIFATEVKKKKKKSAKKPKKKPQLKKRSKLKRNH